MACGAVAFVDAGCFLTNVIRAGCRRKSESYLVFDVAAVARAMIHLSGRHRYGEDLIRSETSCGVS